MHPQQSSGSPENQLGRDQEIECRLMAGDRANARGERELARNVDTVGENDSPTEP